MQGGTHHVNEQPPAYWADLFAQCDFLCFDILREPLWENKNIESYYRQNAFLFIHRENTGFLYEKGFKPTSKPLHIVSPDLFEPYTLAYNYYLSHCTHLQSKLDKRLSARFRKALRKIRNMLK
ncbi:hypothetical protein LS73_008270 [Helicobacter muridarum]|uniref:Uncharacterized protein n=1 Tax=Helicobacter muridarum TaxID=216 RepID=A0A4U8TJ46_9HELI|nr:hypothetical protein [Helicobacter muridarum]TLD98807.1 hypothetical protein LS73_008270 [Helicobacter muridarum]